MGVAEAIEIVALVIFVIALLGSVITTCIWGVAYADHGKDREETKTARMVLQRFLLLCIVSIPFVVFVPTKETVIGMIVAQNITPHNVERAVKAGKDVKDELKKDVLEIIKAIQNPPEKKE
jgi:hypothetical protein